MSSALRGLAPREGLGFVLVKMGHAGPPFEPRRRPQAGKSGDPHSQNADSSLRVVAIFRIFGFWLSLVFGYFDDMYPYCYSEIHAFFELLQ